MKRNVSVVRFKLHCNILISGKIVKEMPGSVASGTPVHAGRSSVHFLLSVKCNTGCPTGYRTQHLFNNSNTNEDIATKFEQEYVCCVRNEEECVCSPLQTSLQYPH